MFVCTNTHLKCTLTPQITAIKFKELKNLGLNLKIDLSKPTGYELWFQSQEH